MKKTRKLVKIIILAIAFGLVCFAEFDSVNAALKKYDILSCGKRKDSGNQVTFYIDIKANIKKDFITYICYDFESKNGDEQKDDVEKPIIFKRNGNASWKYTLNLNKKGKYKNIYIKCIAKNKDKDVSFRTNKIKRIAYDISKPEFSLKGLDELNIGGNTYKRYYDFLGNPKIDSNTYYYRNTIATIGVVVYTGSISVKDIKCKVGNTIFDAGISYEKSGFASTRIPIDKEIEGDVSFSVKNKNNLSATVVTGKRLVIDNTKPVIKIPIEYASKSKIIYKSKKITFPITIIEKHFDSSNTKVLINGKKTNISWKTSGDKNITNIELAKGLNSISIVTTDKAGNVSNKVKSAKIIIDTTAPTVKINGVDNGKSYGNKNGVYTKYPINVKISDKYLQQKQKAIIYRIDESTDKVFEEITLSGSKKGNDYDFKLSDIKNDGYYKLVVSPKDKAGNKVSEKSLSKQTKYEIRKGKVIGYFYINRNGSKYYIDEESKKYFGTCVNDIEDIVIYEYNVNEINKNNQRITLITTAGEKFLTADSDYTWQEVSKERKHGIYQHVYKYTIRPKVFSDGISSIKIVSTADVIGDGNNSLKVESSNDAILNQIINIDTKKPEIISLEKNGNNVLIHVREDNLDKQNTRLTIDGKEVELKENDYLTTSTNIYYMCDWSGDISKVSFECSDLAGNKTKSTKIKINKADFSITYTIVLLIIGLVVLVAIIVVVIVLVNRINNEYERKL